MSRVLAGAAFALVVSFTPALARAGGESAAAEMLFNEAKKLAAEGKYAEACPKFAESNRLDKGAGTLIHLGDCYEKNHQTASAWAAYRDAASAAQAIGRKEWEKLALQRADALEPKLARLTIKVETAKSELEVKRDGTAVTEASFGVATPVDVGAHTVEAKAPGFKPFKTTIAVKEDGTTVEVIVPALTPEPVAPSTRSTAVVAPPVKEAPPENGGHRTLGFVVAGIGVAGVAAGAITGLMTISKKGDISKDCLNVSSCSDPKSVDASKAARTFGLVSTIAFIAGGVGLAAGTALVLTSPKQGAKETASARVLRVAPHVDLTGGGVDLEGRF